MDHGSGPCGERLVLERCEQIIALKIGVVGEHFIVTHPGRQQLQDNAHGVAQAADDWLTVADLRVYGDPVEAAHVRETTRHRHQTCSRVAHPSPLYGTVALTVVAKLTNQAT